MCIEYWLIRLPLSLCSLRAGLSDFSIRSSSFCLILSCSEGFVLILCFNFRLKWGVG